MQLTPLKALALQALQCNQPCNQPATSELHNPSKEPPQDTPICNPPEASEKLGGMEPDDAMPHFREWWWNELDTGADSAEFDAGTTESAQELLPTLRGLVWPDFGVRAEETLLCLNRACVHHYPHDENPDIEDQDA